MEMLSDRTVLLLGAGGAIASQTCFQWALEGAYVIGLGLNSARLQQAKREIDDIRGKFSYFLVDIKNQSQVEDTIKAIFDLSLGVDLIINFVDEYGLTLLSDTPLRPYQTIPNGSSEATHFCETWIREYQQRVNQNQSPLTLNPLKHCVDVISFSQPLENILNAELPAAIASHNPFHHSKENIRYSRLYVEGDAAIASSEPNKDLLWATAPSTKIAPALVNKELFKLLANPDYRTVDDVVIGISGEQIYSWLYHSLSHQAHTANPQRHELGNVLNVHIKETEKGRGMFASKDFAKGELILKTTGKVLNHQTEHTLQISQSQHFEPDAPIRLINHSCEPNAGVKTNQQGIPDFFAFKPIRKDEEITFDYAMTEFTHQTRDDPAMEFELGCRCGAETCRGKLGYYSELPTHLKEAYSGFVSSYLLKM